MAAAISRTNALRLLAAVALLTLALVSMRQPRTAHADPIVLQPVVTGLSSPVGFIDPGDGSGRMFIIEQTGRIKVWNGSAVLPTPFLNLSTQILIGSEQGLLGLAFDPDYETNGFFYVNYINLSQQTVVARYTVTTVDENVANAGSAVVLKTVSRPASNHNGGNLAFGPDGFLYVSMGDSGSFGDPGEDAEDLQSLLGKIWRLDVDNAPTYIPASNPLVGVSGLDEIWAYGLRNPWRFSFDRVTGDLFIGDVGQDSREEVDFQAAGDTVLRNYGWDIMEGSICYEPNTGCNTSGKTLPIAEYTHAFGCSITGGYRYRGPAASLHGTYFYADYCSGRIWGATFSGSVWTSAELTNSPYNVSSFGEDADGNVYVVHLGGAIYRIVENPDFDTDGVLNAADNCPDAANAGQQDADADLLGDACEAAYGANAADSDTDNDGCFDGREVRTLTFLPGDGGDRIPNDFWDFFDLSGDRSVDLLDTLEVLQYFGDEGLTPQADLRDRSAPNAAKPWRSAEADNGVDLLDALASLQQFGHTCT